MVEDLMGVAFRLPGIDAAGQKDQRHPVLPGVGDDIDRIGRARPKGRKQHARRAIRMPAAFGHEAAGVFVLHQNEAQARPVETVHQRQNLAAGNAKGVAAAGCVEFARNDIGTGRHRFSSSALASCTIPCSASFLSSSRDRPRWLDSTVSVSAPSMGGALV